MRTLAHKLGVSETGSPTINTKTIIITEQQAEEFLNENHLHVFVRFALSRSSCAGHIAKLPAVMESDTELTSENKSMEIIRYASIANVSENFSKLLSYAVNTYSPESITVIADHCEADEKFYANNGFIAEKELPPDYMYVIRTKRKPKSEYPRERFRDDPFSSGKTA